MKRLFLAITLFLLQAAPLLAEEKIDLIPPTGYDRAWIYINLGIFWLAVIGLIIMLRMKLREIERVQKMQTKEDEENIPLLD